MATHGARLNIHTRLSPPIPTKVYDTFWRFIAERQAVFFRKITSPEGAPWTEDPILARYRFTNVYRASDRTSGYLVRNVAYKGDQTPEELLFRIVLFKIFNCIGTWERLVDALGEIRYSEYLFRTYDRVLSGIMARGKPEWR